MATMTPRERVLAVLAREIPDQVPYVEIGIDFPFICRLLEQELPVGRHFDSGEYESAAFEIQAQVNEILHRDNLTYHMMPPIPAIKVPGKDNILFFEDGKIKTWDDLDKLQFPDPTSEEYLAPARKFLEKNKGKYAVACSTRVGISASYLAMGMLHFYYSLYDDPKLVQEVIRRYTDFSSKVAQVAAELGFDLFWTSDDIAFRTGTLWSPEMFREYMLPHIRKVATVVRDTGIPWFWHSDGNIMPILQDLIDLGITGINPLEPLCMDIRQVKKEFGDRLILSGNVDVDLLAEGTKEQVREVTKGLLRDVAPGGGYLIASGNSVASYCDVDLVLTMCNTIQEYGKYPININ